MKIKKVVISAIFLVLGIFLIMYSLSRPCDVGDITQTVGNMTAVVKQPAQMNRMICLSTDPVAVVTILLGSASIFPAMSGFYRGLVDE